MTIVIPKGYHLTQALEKKGIICINEFQALTEDIRALRIGILNIMPQAEKYEYSLLNPLGRSVMQIEPIWIRLKSHNYKSTNKEHLDKLYVSFDDAISKQVLDGLIVTGAPVEEIPFGKVSYWEEIKYILSYARENIASALGICWGGMALSKYLGVDNVIYDKKLFGIFEGKNLKRDHRITGDLDDVFWCPQSRHSGYLDETMEKERDENRLNLLAHAKEGGYFIFESSDQRFLMHLGHPEYNAHRLIEEFERDVSLKRPNVDVPINLDLDSPLNRWRGHRAEFFSQWIKFVHETTVY